MRTGFGVSKQFYSCKKDKTIYGLDQGIVRAGPAWLMSNNTIVARKVKDCVGMKFEAPCNHRLVVEKLHNMFVDDTACGCNTTSEERTIMEQSWSEEMSSFPSLNS